MKTETLTIYQILEAASRVTSTPVKVITGSRRTTELVFSRDACFALSKDYLCKTDQSISRALGRERSTITHGKKRHEENIANNPFYRRLYNTIKNEAKLTDTDA
jgi:chromosomal replication initiation ATPase DnaA